MNCRQFVSILEKEVPLSYAEDWDNSGFLVGNKEQDIHKVMVTLDITKKAVKEAIDNQVDFILAHHPIIFSGMTRCTSDSFLGDKLLTLIKHGISCYGMHTNYDVVRMGDAVANKCGYNIKEPVVEEVGHVGIGFMTVLNQPQTLEACGEHMKKSFGLEHVIVFGAKDTKIKKIAVIPGSGKSMMEDAKHKGADLVITGDIGHHDGLDAMDRGLCVIDAGHYGLEQVFMDDMALIIKDKTQDLEVITYKQGSPNYII